MLVFPRFYILASIVFLCWGLWTTPAQASVPLKDQFKANYACQAFQSIRKRTNPGSIRLTPGEIYPVTAKNKEDATYYYLNIENADPAARWVSVDCGFLVETPPVATHPDYLLAISWQPAFCETHQDKKECFTQTGERYDASNFTLHGLWPQPRENVYCNVSNDLKSLDRAKEWSKLPSLALSVGLLEELNLKMPGVASDLHLHEWYKHGTCYSATPEEYYRESLDLLDQVNNSQVRNLFASNIGEDISSAEIREKFDEAFGNDAGKKVAIKCARDNEPTNRRMIVELKLNFQGDIESDTPMADLFEGGKIVAAGCSSGEVDPVGFD